MSFINRIRLLVGLLMVGTVVFGLFVYVNYAMSNITSRSAELESDQYMVSVNYGGTVEKQYVNVGDTVKADDPLFEIRSPSLRAELDAKRTTKKDLLYTLTDEGNILLKAANSGVVRSVEVTEGSYVPDNAHLATLTVAGTEYVVAKYSLNAPDYARIRRDYPITVTLPDNSRLPAKVFDINLVKDGDTVLTVVKARLDKRANIPSTFSSGTPVQTTWELEYNNTYKSIADWVKSTLKFAEAHRP